MYERWKDTVKLIHAEMTALAPGIAANKALEIIESRHADYFLDRELVDKRAPKKPTELERLEQLVIEIAETTELLARRATDVACGTSLRVSDAIRAYRKGVA